MSSISVDVIKPNTKGYENNIQNQFAQNPSTQWFSNPDVTNMASTDSFFANYFEEGKNCITNNGKDECGGTKLMNDILKYAGDDQVLTEEEVLAWTQELGWGVDEDMDGKTDNIDELMNEITTIGNGLYGQGVLTQGKMTQEELDKLNPPQETEPTETQQSETQPSTGWNEARNDENTSALDLATKGVEFIWDTVAGATKFLWDQIFG